MERMFPAIDEDLREACEALERVCDRLEPGGAAPGELSSLLARFGEVKRRAEAGFAAVAAEVSRQSRRELGKDGFARRQGFSSPAALISAETGAATAEAARLIQVGEAIAPRANLVGETLPAKHPHVAAAMRAGLLGMASAGAIISLLDRVVVRAGTAACERMEEMLVEHAQGLTSDALRKLLLEAEARLDPDGAAPREGTAHAARRLTFRRDRDGGVSFSGWLDAESAAPVLTAIDSSVTGILRRREQGADEAMRDDRSVVQMQADVLVDLARHGLGCEQVPTRPTSTVVVRMALDDLLAATGVRPLRQGAAEGHVPGEPDGVAGCAVGFATIDGVEQPVTAGMVRRMAADADIIPMVLGTGSECLDVGYRYRSFTPAQRVALAERDGGCAFCGAPPGHTVAHHIRWWSQGGRTDLDNGILLCTRCHHRIHDDGWEIRIEGLGRDGIPWFIPPAWLDPLRAPRMGGRARYALTA